MAKTRSYTFKVCRDYPGVQYGTVTVNAHSKSEAISIVDGGEGNFDWEDPSFTSSLGDGECGVPEIIE